MAKLADLPTAQRFKLDHIIGMLLSKTVDDAGVCTRAYVRIWDTNDRVMVRIEGREFPGMRKRDVDWSPGTSVEPISIVEFQSISQRRPPDLGVIPRIEVPDEPAPTDELAPERIRREDVELVVVEEVTVTPAVRKPKKIRPAPKLVSSAPHTSVIEKTIAQGRICICGCGEVVEKTLKRGHYMRLRNWADDLRRGKLQQSDIPKGALMHMLEKGMI